MKYGLRETTEDKIFAIINGLILTLVLILVLYPLIYVVSCSFSDPLMIVQGKVWLLPINFTLDSYARVFKDPSIIQGYTNSIAYTVIGTSLNLVMTIMGAYPLSRKDFIGRTTIMKLLTFTMFFHGGMIPTYLVIKQLGLINNFWVMILPGAVNMWNLIIMRTFFQNTIPNELNEAAEIDGCSNINLLFKIVLPLSAPIIAVTVLFYAVSHWNAFFNALLYITDSKKYPLQLVLRGILLQSFQTHEMMDMSKEASDKQLLIVEGLKYAIIVVASAPVLMLYPFIQKYFVKGVMIGAIKG